MENTALLNVDCILHCVRTKFKCTEICNMNLIYNFVNHKYKINFSAEN